YQRQAGMVLGRTNKITGKAYVNDTTIMGWEMANEPRPMRPSANDAYRQWVRDTAAFIKSRDKNHLLTIGLEGWISTEDIRLFEDVNSDKNVDYLTVHIWPKNWGWFAGDKIAESFPNIIDNSVKYLNENLAVAKQLDKPLVIEEFGLPRDGHSFDPAAPTTLRDKYYAKLLSYVGNQPIGEGYITGANFWAVGGTARPIKGQ